MEESHWPQAVESAYRDFDTHEIASTRPGQAQRRAGPDLGRFGPEAARLPRAGPGGPPTAGCPLVGCFVHGVPVGRPGHSLEHCAGGYLADLEVVSGEVDLRQQIEKSL